MVCKIHSITNSIYYVKHSVRLAPFRILCPGMRRVLSECNNFMVIASETKACVCFVCSSTFSLTWIKADTQLFMGSMKHHAMQVYGELKVQFQAHLTAVQIMVRGKLYMPTASSPRKNPSFPVGSVTG